MRRHHHLDAAFVLCLGVLAGCSDDPEPGGAPAPSVPSSAQQDHSPSTPSSQSPPPSREFADLSAFGEDRIAAGRYSFVPFGVGPGAPLPVMKVPGGFAAFRGFSIARAEGPGFGAVMTWTVDTVYGGPCTMSGASQPGPTAKDLADALARQRGTTTSDPSRVRLGGQAGLYVEVTGPSDLAECPGSFTLWSNNGGGMRYLQSPGQVDRLWIIDTPGERLVIDATHTPTVPAAVVRQLTAIVRSTEFVSKDG